MALPKLNELMDNLLKISQGDVNSLARANAEFAKSITGFTKLPAEHLEPDQIIKSVRIVPSNGQD